MKDFPAIKISILFVIGILSSKFVQIPFLVLISTLLISLLIFLLQKKYTSEIFQFITFILISFCVIEVGNVYLNISKPNYNLLSENIYKEKNVKITGVITGIELKQKDEIDYYIRTKALKIDTLILKDSYQLLCKVKSGGFKALYNKLKIGSDVEVTGNYSKGSEERNPGEFNYNKYLRGKGISGIVTSYKTSDVKITSNDYHYFPEIIFSLRKFINNKVEENYNDQSAALLRGLLLADRSEISYATKNEFINSGVIHILAVSGLHVGYIVLIFAFLFGRLNIYLRSVLTIIGLTLFLVLINAPASAFRASVMAVILIVAYLTNRSTNLINSVAIAALVLLLINPNQLFTPGFQLSFAAVISIAVIYPIIKNYIQNKEIKNKAVKNILLFAGVSLAAQIGTLPFTIYYFGKISVVALLTNLLVIPVVGIILGVGILSILLVIFSPFIASFFCVVNEFVIKIIFSIIHFAGSSDFSFLRVTNFSIIDILISYLFLSIILIFIVRFKKPVAKLGLLILCVCNFLLFISFDKRELMPDNKLSLMMIDVGQGDAFLLKFPDGKTALIDAGETNFYFDNGERVILPLLNQLGIDKIDYGFVSHVDLDHYGGFISLIHNNKIERIYKPEIDSTEEKDLKFEKYLAENNLRSYYYSKEILKIGNARIYILNDQVPDNFSSNNKSSVLKIVYGDAEFLFTGDLEKRGEIIYVSEYGKFLDSDVLKVGHHGSKTSSSDEFLNLVTPEISLISDGIKNKFHHPSPVVVERLSEYGSEIYRTDLLGAVILQSDGKIIKKVNWRNM
ncbi:MAG TPA: DNA internalization-related competence protein ComEC/Rec2 [Ignavibacteriaceae bacterium]|nr:DNA internalization-related competence protein ComEC/Rec2 [Ignavibacteriaceae bacterium]